MKKKNIRLISAILCIALVLSVILTGCAGEDGVGIKRTKINDKGELIIYYTNGKSENLCVVVGKDGQDGENGEDGADGEDGEDAQQKQPQSVAEAASIALRSAVSIYCTFKEPGKKATEYYPVVTYMLVAHNDEKVIREKLENALLLDYPREKLNILVASDNSTDATNDIVNSFIKEHPDYLIQLYTAK